MDDRIDQLIAEMDVLRSKVDALADRIAGLENKRPVPNASLKFQAEYGGIDQSESSPVFPVDNAWAWVNSASLLPQVAAVCFILVAALILRTLTDNGMLAKETGSYIGMAYCTLLIISGWLLLARQKNIGIVFPVCGTLLMFVIILETHARFGAISSLTAYLLLFITMLATTTISLRFRLARLNCLAMIGTAIAALAIDFPRPHFPPLIFLLWTANMLALISSIKETRCGWSRWAVFFATILAFLFWTAKLRAPFVRNETIDAMLALQWHLPLLAFFAATYLVMSVASGFGRGQRMTLFDMALPTMSILGIYPLAWYIFSVWQKNSQVLGIAGVLFSIIHFAFATLYWRQERSGPGICVFTFAGAVLLLLSLPAATGSMLLSIALWSAMALGLALLSGVCEIGGIRLTSYLLQITACGLGILSGSLALPATAPFALFLTATTLTVFSIFQYIWCRSHPLTCSTGFFKFIDPKDRSGVVVLLAALINSFLVLQLIAYSTFSLFVEDIHNAMLGAQSFFINFGAITLMTLALPHKNKELMGMAIIVIVFGALKVFGYDFFQAHGLPLVVSVFSFGAVATAGSVIINRWQHLPPAA